MLVARDLNFLRKHLYKLLEFFYFLMGWDEFLLAPRPLFGLLYQSQIIEDDCGEIGGMRIGRGNRSTRRKPAPVPLCPQQIPHDLTRARTRAAAVGNWRLTPDLWHGQLLEYVSFNTRLNMRLQHNGAPPHYSRKLHQRLSKFILRIRLVAELELKLPGLHAHLTWIPFFFYAGLWRRSLHRPPSLRPSVLLT
jgi:hypothetical protein